MKTENQQWFEQWFNEDYLKLYAYRDQAEADLHVAFILRVLKPRQGARFLDLGCGVGRHSLALAKQGMQVTGIDQSPTLIQEAQNQLKKQNLPVEFILGDMLHLNELGQYDHAINLFTSFGYFEDDLYNQKVLSGVKNCLNPQGDFILDYLHPDQVRRSLVAVENRVIGNEHIEISKKIENHTVIKTIKFPTKTYQERVKLYTRTEIEKMLTLAGFNLIEIWNDYEGHPWNPHGDRQIFHCKAH
jgi:2-polyprenyl-3-methyl-5-hydroxy-6-metoxy-1,4-benzoquinol methylase